MIGFGGSMLVLWELVKSMACHAGLHSWKLHYVWRNPLEYSYVNEGGSKVTVHRGWDRFKRCKYCKKMVWHD